MITTTTPTTTRRRNLAVDAVLELLAERWPACFSVYERRRRSLKIGIRDEVLSALEGAITPQELGAALRSYTGTPRPRIGLDGNPCGEVTAEQAAAAVAKLAAYAAKRRRRLVAAPVSALPALTIPEQAPVAIQPAGVTAAAAPSVQPAGPKRIGLADLRRAATEVGSPAGLCSC
jgi:sRNA-binding protein